MVETIRAHQANKIKEESEINSENDLGLNIFPIEEVKTEYSSPDSKFNKSTNSENCSDFKTASELSKDVDQALKISAIS